MKKILIAEDNDSNFVKHPDLPILALTANAFDSDRQLAMDAGCDDFLSKPVSSEECLETIKRYIGE